MSWRVAWAGGVVLAVVAVLVGCDNGMSNQERDDRRYRACLDAGGDYYQDGGSTVWSCTLP